jgi:hypothetical protein
MNFLADVKISKQVNKSDIRSKFVNNIQRRITSIYKLGLQNEFAQDLAELYKMKQDPARYMDIYIKFV